MPRTNELLRLLRQTLTDVSPCTEPECCMQQEAEIELAIKLIDAHLAQPEAARQYSPEELHEVAINTFVPTDFYKNQALGDLIRALERPDGWKPNAAPQDIPDGTGKVGMESAPAVAAPVAAQPAQSVEADKEAIMLAYGLLWHTTTSIKRIHVVRRILRDQLTREQQGQGIELARKKNPGLAEISQTESMSAMVRDGDAHPPAAQSERGQDGLQAKDTK